MTQLATIERPTILIPFGLPWIIQTIPAMQPIPEQSTATTMSPVVRDSPSAPYFFAFLASAFLSAGSKISPQYRHLTAVARIISPHIGQGRRPSGGGAAVGAGSGSASA